MFEIEEKKKQENNTLMRIIGINMDKISNDDVKSYRIIY